MDKNIVNSIIGKAIKEIRVMSFYVNLKLVCDTIALYIKVDTGEWYMFTTSDGRNIIELLKEDPVVVGVDKIEDEFAYPIRIIDLNFFDKRFKGIKEYIWKNRSDEMNGFYIELDQGPGFSIFDQDGCLRVSDGIKMNENFSLV